MFAKSKKSLSVNELLNAVDAARDQISALRQDRTQIEAAPRVLADVMTDLDAHLDSLATDAIDALSLYQLRDRRGTFGLRLSQSGLPDVGLQTLLGVVIAVARGPIRDLIEGQLRDLDAARPGMNEGDRAARLAALDAEILRAELAEEGAIRQLERLGVQIGRRADASPLAVLASDAALAG